MQTSGSRDPLGKGLFYTLLSLAVAITLLQRAFPSQDGPLHLYYSDVLANLLRGTDAYARDYQIKHLFPPYAFASYALVALNMAFAPLLSEKLLVAAYIVWFAVAFRYLVQSVVAGNELVPLLAVPLALNKLLFMGFYNFSFGVATAMFAMGFWLRNYARLSRRRGLAFLGLMVLLASMHPVALLMTLAFVALHLGLLLWARFRAAAGTARERGLAALAESARPLGYALCGACTLGWIALYTSGGKLALLEPEPRRFLSLLKLSAITPFHATGYRVLLLAFIVCLLVAAGARLLRTARTLAPQEFVMPLMAAVCAVAYIIVPWEINSGAFFPERFPIFAVVFVAATAAGLRLDPAFERRLAVAVSVLVVICVGWQAVLKHRILDDLRAVYDAPVPDRHLNAAVVASVPLRDRDRSFSNFVPDYWAAAHYLRRAHATFLNAAWLDAPIMMLKPRSPGRCSYSDAFPMLECLSSRQGTGPRPDVLVATNGGGSGEPTRRLARSLGMVPLPFDSPWFQFYARPDVGLAGHARAWAGKTACPTGVHSFRSRNPRLR